ncbi:MAG: metallophosphoesterase [Acidimicrobiales bacterium]|nr:metallophosphoesterase [Acidimicrobiales bacterium]
MSGYDVIGDVHGHAEQLEKLLEMLGYAQRSGALRHPERTAVFVGDLIDRREEQQLATLRIVRSMVDAGSAQVVLGNHEFNAVAYATVNPSSFDYCRPHTTKNRRQHQEFLDEVGLDSPRHRAVIDWFRTLPLWLDLDGVRVVHACWSDADIAHLEGLLTPEHTLTDQVVVEGTTKGTRTHQAIEHVLKGPEVSMGGAYYFDKDGHPRTKARAAWWNPDAKTLQAAALLPGGTRLHDADDQPADALPDRQLADGEVPRYTDAVPVVFGHYWFTGTPVLQGDRAACVDYSAGKGGPLVAYRWDAEPVLDASRFVAC